MLQQADERFPVSATPPELSHLNASGEAHMVDVGGRAVSDRVAVAEGFIQLSPEALALVVEGRAAEGDVLAVARVAAIQGAKRTWELIPLCHPLPLTGVSVVIEPVADGLRIEASARTTGVTGVEMLSLIHI